MSNGSLSIRNGKCIIHYDNEAREFSVRHLTKDEARELSPGIPLTLRAKVAGVILVETLKHPWSPTTLDIDREKRTVSVVKKQS